jgi:prepilin-type N-terminal cleavage/methylation domain-containing protein
MKKKTISHKNKLEKESKGFTLTEMLIVIFLILILVGIFSQAFKVSNYFKKARDIKRISDLKALEMAISIYLKSTSSPSLGPTNKAVDEASSTIFISVPFDLEDVRSNTLLWQSKTYYFSQVSSTEYFKNNSNGWIPINFASLIFPSIYSLPADPTNSYNKKLFYSYVFKRSSSTFELNANLEFEDFKQNGKEDKTSNDEGDNTLIYEIGTDLYMMPNNLYL